MEAMVPAGDRWGRKEFVGFVVGLVGFVLILALSEWGVLRFGYGGVAHHPKVGRMLAVTWLMATWWMTEALPIPVTSLVPLVLLPGLGLMTAKAVSRQYINEIIFLFIGGFFIALAIQRWNLHKRMALHLVYRLGRHPASMFFGFMLTSTLLSMWISNTATTMMLLPIALSVVQFYEADDPVRGRQMGIALMLGVAYAATLGGISTPVGTVPNLTFFRIFQINYPQAPEITFVQWMKMGLPVTLTLLPVFWLVLWWLHRDAFRTSEAEDAANARSLLHIQIQALGRMSRQEWLVLAVFLLTALLWVFRSDIQLGQTAQGQPRVIPGWVSLLGLYVNETKVSYHKPAPGVARRKQADDAKALYVRKVKTVRRPAFGDGAVAIAMALLLFLLPAGGGSGERLLNWATAVKIPWGTLLLFGGGFALAAGIKYSGMSQWVGELFRSQSLSRLGAFGIIMGICFFITFLTEFTSNTATTEITLAIVAPIAVTFGGTGVHPFLLMIPVTIAASCAFMMPVATPPNAIAYGSGYIPMKSMIRAGLVLNVISAVLVSVVLYFTFKVMGLDLMQAPSWIQK